MIDSKNHDESTDPLLSSGDETTAIVARFLLDLDDSGDRPAVLEAYCAKYPEYAELFRRRVGMGALLNLAAPDPASDRDEPMPERLGDFRVVDRADGGGMGVVYQAIQEPFNRRVAVKTIRSSLLRTSSSTRARFHREQEALAKLHHTHIVPIFAAGTEGDLQYFAMSWLQGASLQKLVRSAKRLSSTSPNGDTPSLGELASAARSQPAEKEPESPPANPVRLSDKYLRSVARVLADAADALRHAHEAGVFHRDLKPSNIMVNLDGSCSVIDFGLAAWKSSDGPARTDDAVIPPRDALTHGPIGTPQYMAPEQFLGLAKPDAASDVWGLGVTLYESVALVRPFDGKTSEEIRAKVVETEPAPLETHVHKPPRDLSLICRKALAKDPSRRYPSAAAFRDDLNRWLAHEPTSVRRSPARRLQLLVRRNRLLTAAIFFLLAAVGWTTQAEFRRSRAEATSALKEKDAAVAVAESERKQAESERKQAASARRELALHDVQRMRTGMHNSGWYDGIWAKVKEIAATSEGFDRLLLPEALSCLIGMDAEVTREFKEFSSRSIAIGPGGEILMGGVTESPRNQKLLRARIWDGGSAQAPKELAVAGFGPVAFSGTTPIQLVVDHARGEASLRNLETGGIHRALDMPGRLDLKQDPLLQPILPVALAPDGSCAAARVLQADDSPGLAIWRAGSSKAIVIPHDFSVVAFSPDGALVAAGGDAGEVRVWEVASGNALARVILGSNRITAVAFGRNPRIAHDDRDPLAPARRWMLVAGDSGGILASWDLGRETPRLQIRSGDGINFEVMSLACSSDGAIIAAAHRYGVSFVSAATGAHLVGLLTGNYPYGLALSQSADSAIVGSEDSVENPKNNSVRRFRIENGRGVRSFHGFSTKPMEYYFSRGGKHVFGISDGFEIGVWDRETAALKCIFQAPGCLYADNAGLAISPDEKRIAYCSNRTARIWEIETGRILRTWENLPKGLCDKLVFLDNDRLVLIRTETTNPEVDPYGRDSDPRAWPRLCVAYELSAAGDPPLRKLREIRDYNIAVTNTALTPDGKTLILDGRQGTDHEHFQRWIAAIDLDSGRTIWRHSSRVPMNNPGGIFTDFDGTLVLASVEFDDLHFKNDLIEVASGVRRDSSPWIVRISNKSREIITDYNHGSAGNIVLRNNDRQDPILVFKAGVGTIADVAGFSGDGNQFLGWIGDRRPGFVLGDLPEINRRLKGVGLGW